MAPLTQWHCPGRLDERQGSKGYPPIQLPLKHARVDVLYVVPLVREAAATTIRAPAYANLAASHRSS